MNDAGIEALAASGFVDAATKQQPAAISSQWSHMLYVEAAKDSTYGAARPRLAGASLVVIPTTECPRSSNSAINGSPIAPLVPATKARIVRSSQRHQANTETVARRFRLYPSSISHRDAAVLEQRIQVTHHYAALHFLCH